MKRTEVGEDAFKSLPSWDEGWEGESQDLQSMRCVTDSLPQVHKPLQHVHHLAPLLCQPGRMGSGAGVGSAPPCPRGQGGGEGGEACSPAEDEEKVTSMLMPSRCAGA